MVGCSVNGSAASANQKTVRLSSSGVTVEFDLHSFGAHGGIGAYNGGTGSDFGNKLFDSAAGGDVSDGENYIKLLFTNRANAQFKVTFEGYYDK